MIPIKKITIKSLSLILLCGASIGLTGCFDDSDSLAEQYKDWRVKNENYVDSVESLGEYTKLAPTWAPGGFALVKWHNDRTLTENNLSPMDNSVVNITYELFDIEGNRLSDSFTKQDSIYTSRPNQNIIGVWAPLTQMHVGDSVTIVIPSQAGYGEYPNGNIKPYSTLIYNIKLKSISAYEVP